ncbi:MAG: hypothetical protein KJ000_05345 [Pirellulaceae bacterium]|nr:hypothetical protein [Pirellulaceae bacterium]
MIRPSGICWGGVFLLTASLVGAAEVYEIGGPLAGVRLERFPTQRGEAPGYPGCIPELMAAGEVIEDMGNEYRQWGPQGQAPEWHLYDGSVEHWRGYMFKYMPIRSFFDRQSQLKNFVAADLADANGTQIERYAEPLYWVPRHDSPQPTGRHAAAVPVLRMKAGSPVLRLDLGELPPGLYAVRVIGAVETSQLRPFREPLYMRMTINDGRGGAESTYRRRLGYCDQFYSVAEFYFHSFESRRYRAGLSVAQGSTVELLVHNVSLDDVLAGTQPRALKTRTTIASAVPAARQAANTAREKGQAAIEPLSREERLRRDAAIWNTFPPINAQGSDLQVGKSGYGSIRGVRVGSAEWTGEQIVEQYGDWVAPERAGEMRKAAHWDEAAVFLANPKLNLVYTVDDLRAGRTLPDPYPLKDDGAGLYFPAPDDPASGAAWTPIGVRVRELIRDYYNRVGRSLQSYKQRGNPDDAHDAAIALVRYALDFPTFDDSESLSSTVSDPGPFGRDASCRRRFTEANFLPHYPMYVRPIMFQYDELFEAIRDNRQLADSVGRFVPWVKTPDDVIRLIDIYLVQTVAKRIMRYHYHTDVVDLANLAAVVGNREATDPWMEWLFSRTFIYPLPVAGVGDVMISGCTREGTEVVGSTFYAQEEGALRVADSLGLYLRAGGNPQYDLSDSARYPKPAAHAFWRLDNVVAGGDFLRIGDVCGPDKAPGHTLRDLSFARAGWEWTQDPQFAFVIKHYLGRGDESDADWTAIEQAAASQRRAPWLDRASRVMPMWAGVLEAGLQHDDYRFRRAAYLRLGFGMGHHHFDSLDLQIVAHGLPMTIDGGQRPGYSTPGDRTTRVHNVVQVDDHPAYRHSWATALADHNGARYLAAECDPPPGIDLWRRQIALIDAGQDGDSQPLTPTQQMPGAALPVAKTTPDSYVFDVVRIGGGHQHTYNFHGPLNDDFTWNATDTGPPKEGFEEAEYLSRFSRMPEQNMVGQAPAEFQATWRMARELDGIGRGEKEMLGVNFDPQSPPKFLRLHLLGVDGARALRGEFVCQQWKYHFTNLSVALPRAETPTPRVLTALIEPYAGQAFLSGQRQLAVQPNEADARRAVAVEVKTAAGHTDVCFADGRPDQMRSIQDAGLKVAGEFAYYSVDDRGLRQATLTGGRSLVSPLVRIETEADQRRSVVTRVDYLQRQMWVEPSWPARSTTGFVETGIPGHWTSYTITGVVDDGDASRLSLLRGGDYFRSPIEHVDADSATVTATLRPLVESIDHHRAGWVASDDAARVFARAEYLGAGRFRLEGDLTDHLAEGDILRLWEYGVGDTVRQSTTVSLRRTGDTWELNTDVAVRLSLPVAAVQVSRDGASWSNAGSTSPEGWTTVAIEPADKAIRLRISQ